MKPTDVLTPPLHGLCVCQWNPEQQRSGAVEKALLNCINSLLPSLQNMLNSIGPMSCIHPIICFYNVLSDQLERRLQYLQQSFHWYSAPSCAVETLWSKALNYLWHQLAVLLQNLQSKGIIWRPLLQALMSLFRFMRTKLPFRSFI